MATVEAICIASSDSAPMQSLAAILAIADVGLSGDRYALGTGFYSSRPTAPGAREVTLIEAEVLDLLQQEHGIRLEPEEHRRNLTVRGIKLNELIGQQFAIGDVVLEGVKDCPPCEHLQELTGKAVIKPLTDRGGLRARILVGGTLRVGDSIAVHPRVESVLYE